MKKQLVILALLTPLLSVAPAAHAQEFKPYPKSKITLAQWTQYHDKVVAKPGLKKIEASVQKLVIYQDRSSGLSVAFTQFGNPAHPAWISRRMRDLPTGLEIDQIGYYAGDLAAFERLNADFQTLNEDLIAQSRRAASGVN